MECYNSDFAFELDPDSVMQEAEKLNKRWEVYVASEADIRVQDNEKLIREDAVRLT